VFAGRGPQGDVELWVTNGTAAGTRLLADLGGPSFSSEPRLLHAEKWQDTQGVAHDDLFFTAWTRRMAGSCTGSRERVWGVPFA
jgi:ELWxxDGT repeat protein